MHSVVGEALQRLRKLNDEIAFTLTIHLFTEYWLNKLIKEKCKDRHKPKIKAEYSKKLKYLYDKGFIPEEIYNNLKKFNYIRNKFSHDLNYKLDEKSFEGFSTFNITETVLEQEGNLNKLIFVGMLTYGALNTYCHDKYNLSNEYN